MDYFFIVSGMLSDEKEKEKFVFNTFLTMQFPDNFKRRIPYFIKILSENHWLIQKVVFSGVHFWHDIKFSLNREDESVL